MREDRKQYRDIVDSSHLPLEIILGGERQVVEIDGVETEVTVGGTRFVRDDEPVRYGLVPGSAAAVLVQDGYRGTCVTNTEVIQEGAKIRSYGNIEDWDTGINLLLHLNRVFPGDKFCAVLKHAIDFGVARADNIVEAYLNAWRTDPIIPFGGVIALNDVVDKELAVMISKTFIDGLVCKGITDDARELLAKKKDLRIRGVPDIDQPIVPDHGYEIKSIRGGILLCERYDSKTLTRDDIIATMGRADDRVRDAALLQWAALAYVRSNAAVFGDDTVTYGAAGGEGARVYAIRNALETANRHSPFYRQWRIEKDRFPLVLCTDGFGPEVDSVEACDQYGVKHFMAPTGSLKDSDVANRARELGMTMMRPANNERPFTHR